MSYTGSEILPRLQYTWLPDLYMTVKIINHHYYFLFADVRMFVTHGMIFATVNPSTRYHDSLASHVLRTGSRQKILKWGDLGGGGWCHSRSFALSPFSRAHTASFLFAVHLTMSLHILYRVRDIAIHLPKVAIFSYFVCIWRRR